MVGIFAVVSVLVLLLVFFIIKLQSSQKEISLLRLQSKKSLRHSNQINASKDILALTWQHTLLSRLHSGLKRASVSEQDGKVLETLFAGFSDLLHLCINEGSTLEEALIKYLSNKEGLVLQDVKEVVKKYPQDIRLAWSKNNVEGLIVTFTKLSERIDPTLSPAVKKASPNNKTESSE